MPQRQTAAGPIPVTVRELVRSGRSPGPSGWRRASARPTDTAVDAAIDAVGLADQAGAPVGRRSPVASNGERWWPARSPAAPTCCCSTSRSPASTRPTRSARRHARRPRSRRRRVDDRRRAPRARAARTARHPGRLHGRRARRVRRPARRRAAATCCTSATTTIRTAGPRRDRAAPDWGCSRDRSAELPRLRLHAPRPARRAARRPRRPGGRHLPRAAPARADRRRARPRRGHRRRARARRSTAHRCPSRSSRPSPARSPSS